MFGMEERGANWQPVETIGWSASITSWGLMDASVLGGDWGSQGGSGGGGGGGHRRMGWPATGCWGAGGILDLTKMIIDFPLLPEFLVITRNYS